MSIRVKNVMVDSPMDFVRLYDYYLPATGVLLEHSPIYQQITAEVNISGSYSPILNIDYDFSYSSGVKTWTRIPIVGDSALGVTTEPTPYYDSISYFVPPGSGEFIMALDPALTTPIGIFGQSPMYCPQYPAARFIYDDIYNMERSVKIGTMTDSRFFSPPVITDLIANVGAGLNFFFSDEITEPRQIMDLLKIGGGWSLLNAPFLAPTDGSASIDEDLTTWSLAKWRDFRGSWSATETNAEGITTTMNVTLA
jgi:hypothetical protein